MAGMTALLHIHSAIGLISRIQGAAKDTKQGTGSMPSKVRHTGMLNSTAVPSMTFGLRTDRWLQQGTPSWG
jgi:hypothetical protein